MDEIVSNHYLEEAQEQQLKPTSTMPDQNIRRLEIQNIIKYLNDGEKCLEVGCGNGYASIEISKIKQLELLSIDATQELIKLAKKQSTQGIKGTINFSFEDILKFDTINSFDTVFSIRCIINILNWNDQKKSLTNITRSIRNHGRIILLETFTDGLQELNKAREELGFPPIKAAPFNLHLDKQKVISHFKSLGFKLIIEDNFLSTYYFWTRVIYPAVAKSCNSKIVFNSKIDEFFSLLPSYGNFGHIKILGFKKF